VDHTSRDANLLGALALAVSGRILGGGAETQRLGPSAAAALVAVSTWLAGGSVQRLGEALGLTHSGAVRLVDRLVAEGLLDRRPGADARTRALAVTPAGARAAARVQRERAAALEDVLAALDARERARLTPLAEAMLAHLTAAGAPPGRTCRLCDARACGHYEGRCPVTQAAHAG